ncbi:MAG: hypothetical protein ACFFDN_42060, partial [Candidatus Hodarchaeota archaeon]
KKLILLIFMPIFLITLIIPIINLPEISYWPFNKNKINNFPLYSSATPNLAWNGNGTIVTMTNRSQYSPKMCSDGSGGVIITFPDLDDIYAQRFNSEGIPQWTINGSIICNANDPQNYPLICSDGAGGAIITWADWRDVGVDIYAQRVNYDGVVQWTANGTVICNDSTSANEITICSDGNGGAIIAWTDTRYGTWDVFAQKIDINGIPQWNPNGVDICTAGNLQTLVDICNDGAGGAILTWRDSRFGDDDIYAQRINSDGTINWTANGTAICKASNTQSIPRIISDNEGGAIITWQDTRNVLSANDIYAQRINSEGQILWIANGTPICTNVGGQINPRISSDGVDGWVITWVDGRSSNTDIYAQRINPEGIPMWSNNGLAVCTANDNQYTPELCTDGNGVIIAWVDYRNYGLSFEDIYAQRISSDGTVKWTTNGIAICSENYTQQYPAIASDGKGGAFIAWEDYRGFPPAIYAQFIKNKLPTSNNPGTIITTTSGSDMINWILSDDFGSGSYIVWANDSNGKPYVWVEAPSWSNNTSLNVPINRTVAGTYQYTIEFFDDQNQPGIPNSVIVKIIDDSSIPSPDQPTETVYLFSNQGNAEFSNLALPLFIGIIMAFAVTIIAIFLLSRRIREVSGSKIVTKK